jgi:hypothetical protein
VALALLLHRLAPGLPLALKISATATQAPSDSFQMER